MGFDRQPPQDIPAEQSVLGSMLISKDAVAEVSEVLGYEVQAPPPGFDSWEAALDAWGVPPAERGSRDAVLPPAGQPGPRLFFQRVPEPKTVKNRMHWDVYGDVADLVGRGATVLDEQPRWTVLADPEGNEFCVFPSAG